MNPRRQARQGRPAESDADGAGPHATLLYPATKPRAPPRPDRETARGVLETRKFGPLKVNDWAYYSKKRAKTRLRTAARVRLAPGIFRERNGCSRVFIVSFSYICRVIIWFQSRHKTAYIGGYYGQELYRPSIMGWQHRVWAM